MFNRISKNVKKRPATRLSIPEIQAYLPHLPEYYPVNFSINLGAAPCNHSCLFCPQSIKKPSQPVWLDLKILEKVLNEMPSTGVNLNISAYTETLSAPNLVDSVKLMKTIRPGLPVFMATNGSLFNEKIIRELLSLGLDHYSYSFDAPTRETYRELMQVDHYDRVDSNFRRIIELRNEVKSKTKITAHIMKFDQYVEHFDDFYNERIQLLDPNLGDDIYLRTVGNWGGDAWDLDSNFKKIGLTYETNSVPDETKRYPCLSIFTHFKLQHTGHYAPCVAAVPDSSIDTEMHKANYLGHASDITWLDAWISLSDLRQQHLAGDWAEIPACKTCNIWSLWPNTFMSDKNGFSHHAS